MNVTDTDMLGTLASSVYGRLRSDILDGKLAPGMKLRVGLVRELYDAGNSPVREALNRLSSDGLVVRLDQRGFTVAPVSAEDLHELTVTRCTLEDNALRASIANRTSEWEDTIVLALHRLVRLPRPSGDDAYRIDPEWERAHRAFHTSLLAACGSHRLLRFCEQLSDEAYRYRQLAVEAVAMRPTEDDEHRAIMTAAIDGDADKAVKLLKEHYRTTTKILAATDLFGPQPPVASQSLA